MESCHYTRRGLTSYITAKGVKETAITRVDDVAQLETACQQEQPCVVFLNEECFANESEACTQIRQLIKHYPDTLFFIFMALSNTRFEEFLCPRNNLIITSKSIKISTLDKLLGKYFQQKSGISLRQMIQRDVHPLTLSHTESRMLKMWMDGNDTSQISEKMQIKIKTVSSHKGNIRRKIKMHNKQMIYHVVKLVDNVTSGIYVNSR